MVNWRRFGPYMKDREAEIIRKAREEQEKRRNFINTQDRSHIDPLIKARIQRQRIVTMRSKRIKVTLPPIMALTLLALLWPHPAQACHRFSRWHYPYPQRCNTGLKHDLVYHIFTDPPLPPIPQHVDIPLPDMNATWGGAMDSELELQMERQKALRSLGDGKSQ